jgi:beta-1,4-mannosyltransferase
MNQTKVLFTPSWEKANPYQRLLKEACEKEGCDIEYANYPSGFFPFYKLSKKNKELSVIHVHWISELLIRLVWSANPILFCWLVKRRGIKLIWTIHNKFAHENQHRKRELQIRKSLSRMADKVILHSQEALNEINKLYNVDLTSKAEIIFHGNYSGCYPTPTENRDLLRAKELLQKDDIVILFFGSLKPYKGIETLIHAYINSSNINIKLYIAGEPYSKEYKERLIELTKNRTGISTYFTYLNDQELIDHLHFSDVVVLPFSDTLTSGTAILAMTEGKALVLAETAKVFGCVPDSGVNYFNNEQQLVGIINQLDLNTLNDQGLVNLDQSKKMSWSEVGKMTVKTYQGRF